METIELIWEVSTNYTKYFLLGNLYLFVAYVLVMKLKGSKLMGTPLRWPLIIFVGIPAITFDWIMNWYATPFFWDVPDSFFEVVTERLKRYKLLDHSTFKYRFAASVCRILDRFDPSGDHC
jgi:hypothetical protein